jgi:hypothetical protein
MNRNAPRTNAEGNFINNIILDSIPQEEFAQLKPNATPRFGTSIMTLAFLTGLADL